MTGGGGPGGAVAAAPAAAGPGGATAAVAPAAGGATSSDGSQASITIHRQKIILPDQGIPVKIQFGKKTETYTFRPDHTVQDILDYLAQKNDKPEISEMKVESPGIGALSPNLSVEDINSGRSVKIIIS